MKSEKRFIILIIVVCMLNMLLFLSLYKNKSISLGYFLMLILIVLSLALNGFVIYKLASYDLQNKLYNDLIHKIDKRIGNIELYSDELKSSEKGDIIQEVISITQAQMSNHISSVNITLIIISIICMFISIIVPIFNYTFLNKEQIANMYNEVDSKVEEMQLQVQGIVDEVRDEINENVKSQLEQAEIVIDDEIKKMNDATLFRIQVDLAQNLGYEDQIQQYKSLLENNPFSSELYYYLGSCQYYQGDYLDAIENLTYAKNLGYSNGDMLDQILCYSYQMVGDYFSVIDICNQHIPEEWYDTLFTEIRAEQYKFLGLYEKAEEEYLKVIDIYDKKELVSYSLYVDLGSLYGDWGRYEAAIDWYSKAIDHSPDFLAGYVNRGLIYYLQKEYDKAISDYTRCIELAPDSFIGYRGRSEVYFETGKYYLALDDLDKVMLITPPDCGAVYERRGLVYLYLENYDKAIDDLRMAVAVNDCTTSTYYNLAFAYEKKNNLGEALHYISIAIDMQPDVKVYYDLRAKIYKETGEDDLCKQDLEKANSLSE